MSMRSHASLFLASLVSLVSFTTVVAQTTPAPGSRPHVPAGYLLIEEEQWEMLSDEPSRHLGRARDAFLVMDTRTAAAEMRKAAVHVRVAAEHALERSKRSLTHSEHELEQTARRIETGMVKSVEDLDLVTARALHALANDQYAKASDAWRKRELRRSGQFLRSATNNLERAAARTDATMRAATAEVAKDSRLISGKLIEGTGFVMDEVGAGLESVGHQIEKVGSRVLPHTPK